MTASAYGYGVLTDTLDATTTSISAYYLDNPSISYSVITLTNAFSGTVVSTSTEYASAPLIYTGLSPATRYSLTSVAYDATGTAIGEADELLLDTALTTMDNVLWVKWRGERDGWDRRKVDADKQRVSVSAQKTSRWMQYDITSGSQNKRLVMKSTRLVMHTKAQGREARTPKRG